MLFLAGLFVVGGSGKVDLLLRVRLPGAGSAAAGAARRAARVCIATDFSVGFVGRKFFRRVFEVGQVKSVSMSTVVQSASGGLLTIQRVA